MTRRPTRLELYACQCAAITPGIMIDWSLSTFQNLESKYIWFVTSTLELMFDCSWFQIQKLLVKLLCTQWAMNNCTIAQDWVSNIDFSEHWLTGWSLPISICGGCRLKKVSVDEHPSTASISQSTGGVVVNHSIRDHRREQAAAATLRKATSHGRWNAS